MRLLSLWLLAWLGLYTASPGQLSAADARPNILFIMTDDHAAHAISAYGSVINQTPHLDRLAKEGMRFERCFVTNSICTPSRATLLTGKYSHLNGVPVFNRFDGSQTTAPKLLQSAGYHTGMIGKWHLGSNPTGFDYWMILPGQGAYNNPVLYDEKGNRNFTGYVTDIITDLSIEFIEKRPKDKPFVLYCHHKAPHREWEPSEKYKAEFRKKKIPEPATLFDNYEGRTDALKENRQRVFDDMTRRDLKLSPPDELKGPERQAWLSHKPTELEVDGKLLKGEELNRYKYQRYMQDYLACVQSVDDGVGKLLDYLDKSGLAKNTVVIYTSDQGFFLGEHGMYDKRFMYEESLKMPFLVRYPGVTAPGSVTDKMAINPDFAPTMLDIAGVPVPTEMQGRSLKPVLQGQAPADWRKAMYYRYYHDPGDHNTRAHYGIRTETHKLIYFWKKNQYELYDLTTDPKELNNLAESPKHQELLASMKQQLVQIKKEMKDDDQFAEKQPGDRDVNGPMPKGKKK